MSAGLDTRAAEAMFARYAYPPNELGYCGQGDGRDLLEFAHRSGDRNVGSPTLDMSARARVFDGALPYLEHLAGVASADSLMDQRVVEAYWVGNDLLERIEPESFAAAVTTSFARQRGADLDALRAIPGPVPHHSFHVFAIYPWMAMLRRTGAAQALDVLDKCRIRWGRVDSVHQESVLAQCRPLTWDGTTLRLGAPRPELTTFSAAGRSLTAAVRPGDWVALHWNWVCDRLSPVQLAALRKFTDHQLAITNRG